MSDDKIKQFPKKKPKEVKINVRDIECLAILTNKDEQYYIDDPTHITQIIAFIQQRGMKFQRESFPGE